MKTTAHLILLVAIGSAALAGCRKPTQKHPGQWFETATGLPLPAKAEELNAEAIVVLAVGDTYYLRLKTDAEFQALLQAEFTSCTWSDAKDYLVPPKNWLDDLPFWDRDAVRKSEHYRRIHVDKGGTRWLSYISYSAEDGIGYVVGVQTRG